MRKNASTDVSVSIFFPGVILWIPPLPHVVHFDVNEQSTYSFVIIFLLEDFQQLSWLRAELATMLNFAHACWTGHMSHCCMASSSVDKRLKAAPIEQICKWLTFAQ